MGKVRDLFKKIGATKAISHGKIGTIKAKNGKDLSEVKILRRGSKNTQNNCTKKALNDPHNHDGVVSLNESHTSWTVKASGP